MSSDLSYIDRLMQRYERSGTSLFIRTYLKDTMELVNEFEFTGVVPGAPVPIEVQAVARNILSDIARLGPAVSPIGSSIDASGATELVVGDITSRLNRGRINLTAPCVSWDGTLFGSNSAFPTEASLTSSSLGSILYWKTEISNDFGRDAFKPGNITATEDLTAAPSKIYLPPGCTQASINACLNIQGSAVPTGIRWVRITRNADAGHLSNFMLPATTLANFSQTLPIATGWIDLDPGDYLELRFIHTQGEDMGIVAGGVSNQGGSSYFRVDFR